MPQQPSVTDVISNPDFQALPTDEKVKFLGMLGPQSQVPTPSGLGSDSNLDLDIRGPKGKYQEAMMGAGRAFGGASEQRSLAETINPVSKEPGITGRAETLANLAQILPISKALKAGLAIDSLPITERLSQLLNRPITSTVNKTVESSGTKELTNATAQNFTSEAEKNVQKGRNLQGQFAGKGTTAITQEGNSQVNLASKLADTTSRQTKETSTIPLVQLLEQMNPKTALAIHAAASFGPAAMMSVMRILLANTVRAATQVTDQSPDQSQQEQK